MDEMLTVSSVAKVCDRTPDAIRKAADAGRIKVAQRTPSGVRLFARSEAERFAEFLRQGEKARRGLDDLARQSLAQAATLQAAGAQLLKLGEANAEAVLQAAEQFKKLKGE